MEPSPAAEASPQERKEAPVMYEELAELEKQFDDVDVEILRKQYTLQAPLYAKRNALIASILHFWRLVVEQAPPEIDTYIQPSDSEVLNACLTNITVERFEIAAAPAAGAAGALHANGNGNGTSEKAPGDPRSLLIRFEFAPNEYFTNDVLEKRFWYRRGKDGWTGLVSEPVRIAWKEGKDMTEGLGDLACDAWEAEKNLRAEGKGDEEVRNLPVWRELLERVAASTPGSLSFFAWWGFRGRLVSKEESELAVQAERERRQGITIGDGRALASDGNKGYGEEDDDEDIEEDGDEDAYAHEIFPLGDELAISIAEDLYPAVIKYFTQAQEQDLSEADFEDDSDDDADDDGDGEGSGSVPNLRELVNARGDGNDDRSGKGRREDGDDEDRDDEERRPRKRTRT